MLFLQGLSEDDIAQDIEATTETIQKTFATWWHKLLDSPKDALVDLGGWALHAVVIILAAAVVYIIGRWVIKRKVDSSLVTFTISLTKVVLYIALILGVISILGVKTTSFIAIMAAAGFALGMALSGTLQNFAGGVMVLLLKPYRVGDYIVAQGQEGTVTSIQLFNTILATVDNKTVILPNGAVSTGIIMNTSAEETRRVEWIFGINYGDDFAQAQKVIRQILDSNPLVIHQQDYTIEIKGLGDSAVNLIVRAWTNSEDYWTVFFSVNAEVYKTLPEKGIKISLILKWTSTSPNKKCPLRPPHPAIF